MRTNAGNIVKIVQTHRPWGEIPNFYSLGAVFPHIFPNKRDIWHGGADLWCVPPCQISPLSMQRVTTWGEKPIFGALSKCNTGMAALRAGLPLIIQDSAGYIETD